MRGAPATPVRVTGVASAAHPLAPLVATTVMAQWVEAQMAARWATPVALRAVVAMDSRVAREVAEMAAAEVMDGVMAAVTGTATAALATVMATVAAVTQAVAVATEAGAMVMVTAVVVPLAAGETAWAERAAGGEMVWARSSRIGSLHWQPSRSPA